MTYRILLENLLKDCVQKGKAFGAALGGSGQATTYMAAIKRELEVAEDAYELILAQVMSGKVKLDDPVSSSRPVPQKPRIDLSAFPAVCYN
jgi:hypothetical protein